MAAFITPNHPYIAEIVKNAGPLLAKWTGAPSFTGYQSKNPDNVKKQMAALYGALVQEKIVYCMPPASFEEDGQKVRLCGTIKDQKLATCLDLALLYAGCLEACDLHPMIVIVNGHAFAGCWLEEESFAECVQDDVTTLTKRVAPGINEICVVETTAFTQGKGMSFDHAVSAAGSHLLNPGDFVYLVDIIRSRGSGIRPIPQAIDEGAFPSGQGTAMRGRASVTGRPDELEVLEKLKPAGPIEFTKQQLWERKLLDLSLRNPLLNFRVTKNSIQLFAGPLHDLEDELADGKEFQIMPRPQDMEQSPRDDKIYKIDNMESIWGTLIKSELKNNRVRTHLDEAALSGAISNLYRSARTSMEENGANTLYLALGFLKWYENNVSERPRYAPLAMIPVDIIRKSARGGYVFRLRDEEPQFNITLLEMLRQNFGTDCAGLDPLPADEHGIDIKMVFHIVRQLVMGKPRWDIEEELAFIGIFSFTRFIMWNDIRNRTEDLLGNKIVKSLVSGRLEWEPDTSFLPPDMLDDTVAPEDLAVPVSADSSQLAAIHAAGQGRSFVLHGPPGTGKSQTITNIIANALFQGRSVLFVAEKMAALDVVDRRLKSIGLGEFCLELHSNKARKKDVLGQLEKALDIGRIKPPQNYNDEANAILALRKDLNTVVRELHTPRPFGFSLYEAISRVEKYSDHPDCMDFSDRQIRALTARRYSLWEELCGMLSAAVDSCGDVNGHALMEYKNPRYSHAEKEATVALLDEYLKGLSGLESIAKQVSVALLSGEIKTRAQYKALAGLCSLLAGAIRIPASALLFRDLPLYEEKIAAACASGRRKNAIKESLGKAFSGQLLGFDAETAALQWRHAEASWFLPKLIGESKIAKSVKFYALDPKGYGKSETPKVLELVCEYHKAEAVVNNIAPLLGDLYGIVFDNGNCDWTLIENITKLAVNIQKLIKTAAGDSASQSKAIESLSASLDKNLEGFAAENRSSWANLIGIEKRISELETCLSAKFNNAFEQWHDAPDWISAMTEKASRWISNIGGLRDYSSYLKVKSDLDDERLQTVYNALENGLARGTDLVDTFIKNISKACVNYLIDSTPALRSFHGNLFSQKIDRLKAVNDRYQTLTKQELAARLSALIPVLSLGVSDSSEIGILLRAIRSGGRMMPVRKLFKSIPNLLRKLCPCMLMSPISVAQYLDPKHPAFDLVIFDEASQLPTSEAVGAIARGRELIVVGDPKQLPPTSFFMANQMDEENYDEDLESVLDDCLALSMPQEHLLWHYRSRHESLIAFSNRKYYDNKLYTFPSPDNMVSQVRLVPVEGYYDRGRTKQNIAEAEAVVREIISRLSDPKLKNMSIGVVTFSSAQQNLIADMLDAEFCKRPDLDEIANEAEEPVFIKNLENVQGDERDVILFSVGYGPDRSGRVALNFGPLNREGGWRRLNVAVSRARYEMLVFSVLKPEQIDLGRTRADGLAGLKAFLEFADRGISALPGAGIRETMSQGVVGTIAERIRGLGYTAGTNIGCSGYQVDIGVIHPDDPEAYVIGILCDSPNYYNGGTALDRNCAQEAVLRGLGWQISRIWVLDWWDDPEKELRRIQSDIEAAIEKYAAAGPVKAAPHTPAFEKMEHDVFAEALETYEPAHLEKVRGYQANPDYFAGYESTNKIKRQIETVLEAEAPVCREVLCKRVLEAWGIARMGSRINRRFEGLFSMMQLKSTKEGDAVFYWKKKMDPGKYESFRVPSKGNEDRRSLEHIPPQEIAAAVKYILGQQIGLPRDDLEREVSRIFGFARCTEAMQERIREGIKIAVEKKWAIDDGARIIAAW
ncbi:MAG: DUF3320 domain-containing protein [Clostridiales bacterium]|nr:DUF3320 domain-containing protein [Clostridiales bacterium]